MLGRIAGDLRVGGGSVDLDAEVGGDVRIAARALRIGASARIAGDLEYWSATPADIASSAVIGGRIVHHRTPDAPSLSGAAVAAAVGGSIAWYLGLLLAGALLLLVFPGPLAAAVATLRGDGWRSLGVGLLVLLATPPAILFCFVVVVGIPLALALIAGYAFALFAAYLTAGFWLAELFLGWIGRAGTGHRGLRLLGLALGLVALGVIGWIPFLGWLLVTLATAAALGAWALRAVAGDPRTV